MTICNCSGETLHTITCATVAESVPYALCDEDGFVFYPEGREDADLFMDDFPNAKPVDPDAFAAWYDVQEVP